VPANEIASRVDVVDSVVDASGEISAEFGVWSLEY
jgi:hypothetical protein